MKNSMALIFIFFTLCAISSLSFALDDSFQTLMNGRVYTCVGSDNSLLNQVQCAHNCTTRNSAGNCMSYGLDFCSANARCAAHCTTRDSSGNCHLYSADFCGEFAQCVPNCVARGVSGNCHLYGADVCQSGY